MEVEHAAEDVTDPAAATQNAEAEKHPPRRSTVRERVSFVSPASPESLSSTSPESASAPADQAQSEAAPPAEAPTAETAAEARPRRAGWWSRRFGSRE
jgi:ribonuclease E